MEFKFNLVKLEKAIIYQPVFISEDFLRKYQAYTHKNQVHLYGDFRVNCAGSPELCSADKTVFLGLKYCGHKYYSGKQFLSNAERDDYYNGVLKAIKEMINYLKNV